MTKIALKFKMISRCSAENSVIKLLSSERANISIKVYQKVGTSYMVHYLKMKDSLRSVVLLLKISVKQKERRHGYQNY